MSHTDEKFRKETFCVSENFWYPGMVRDKREAGTTIFRQNVLSHSTESFCRGTLLCFEDFQVTKNFQYKKGGGRDYLDFLSKTFVSQYQKLRGGFFCVSKIFSYRRFFLDKRGGEEGGSITIFCQKVLSGTNEKCRR